MKKRIYSICIECKRCYGCTKVKNSIVIGKTACVICMGCLKYCFQNAIDKKKMSHGLCDDCFQKIMWKRKGLKSGGNEG